MGRRLSLAVAVASLLGCAVAGAQTVTLQGMLGKRALLIVDGKPPKGVAPGDTHVGVKVISTTGDEAVERAIMASQPLPVPTDGLAFSQFRNLKLTFRPND